MLGTMYDMAGIPGLPPTVGNRQDFPSSSNFLKRTVFTSSGTWIKSGGCTSINVIVITSASFITGASQLSGYVFSDATSLNNVPITISNASGGSNSFGSLITGTNYATTPTAASMSGYDYLINSSAGGSVYVSIVAQIVVEEYA